MPSLKILPLALAIASVACHKPARIDADSGRAEYQVRFLADEFVHTSLALQPSSATAQGYHVHHGVALDEQLEDYSPANLDRARKFYRLTLERATRLGTEKLPPEFRADLDIVKLGCQSELLDLDRIQPYRHNPTVYVEVLGNALYTPFILNYAPEAKRFAQITARIEKIPVFLETAERNLSDSPEIWNHVAQEENQGNIELVDRTIRAKVPRDLRRRYDAAARNALAALKRFDSFLERDLSKHIGDWRLGSQLYAEKFKLTLATGDTPQQTLADAEARLQSIREDMRTQASAIYPKFFPGQTPPQDANALVSQVLDKIAQQHSNPQQYFADAKRDLADATQFVQDHHLLTLPSANQLEVIPTPKFMQGIYAVGGFSPAPALEPQLGSYFWITPFAPGMSPSRIESKLREYNVYGLQILTIHEAMPGHYVQFEYADELQPPWRRALRAIFSNGPYVEGWAVYATELMIDAGYPARQPSDAWSTQESNSADLAKPSRSALPGCCLEDTPEMRLTFAKQMLRVVSNTILDVKLQTMGMTDQQAMDLMLNQTFQEKEEAEKKLQRAKLSSCQLPTYFVGWRGWDRLRDAYKQKRGDAFHLAQFNERALKEGAVPLPVLNDLVLQEPAAQ